MFAPLSPVSYSHSGLTDAFSLPDPNVAGYSSFSSENRVQAREGDQVVLNQSKFEANTDDGKSICRTKSGDKIRWTIDDKDVTDSKKLENLERFYEEEQAKQKKYQEDLKLWQQNFETKMKQLQENMNAMFSSWSSPVKLSPFIE